MCCQSQQLSGCAQSLAILAPGYREQLFKVKILHLMLLSDCFIPIKQAFVIPSENVLSCDIQEKVYESAGDMKKIQHSVCVVGP